MEWLEKFSPEFAGGLHRAVEESAGEGRKIAVFDADGTLWSADIGEAFLRWLIAGRLVRSVDYSHDVYELYEKRVEMNRAEGFAWAVQLMAGLCERDIMSWSAQLAYAWPNYRPLMRMLVEKLDEAGFEPWIVSASNEWTIKETARYAGFDSRRVIGIRTGVDHGVLSDRIVEPVVCGAGKVEAIRRIVGAQPVLGFGDSMGDYEMLAYCRQGMVVGQRSSPNAAMIEKARLHGWPVQFF